MNNIYKKYILAGLILLIGNLAYAQPAITLEAFGGWLWTSKAGYNGTIKVDDKGNYGVRGGISHKSNMVVEFEWNHTETTLHWYDVIAAENYSEDVTMNYFLLGYNQEVSDGPAIPYGVFNLGVMNLKSNVDSWSENWFTVGLGGGLKYYFSDHVGIRLQARLFLPMQFAGVGFGCGSGGCGSGVSGYTSTLQGDFTGGVVLKLGGG